MQVIKELIKVRKYLLNIALNDWSILVSLLLNNVSSGQADKVLATPGNDATKYYSWYH